MLIITNLRNCLLLWITIITLSIASCQSIQPVVVGASAVDTTQIDQQHSVSLLKPIESKGVNSGPYQAENTRLHQLVHTRLEVRFDWELQHLLGKATLELRPYFYPQDILILDAKGFDIHSIQLLEGGSKKSLSFEYDKKKLVIFLNRVYQRNESYFIAIDYTAKPNELEAGGSEAITSDKGLYFINPLGKVKNKPQQI